VVKMTDLGPTCTWVWTMGKIQLSGWSQDEGYEHSGVKNHEGGELRMEVAGFSDEVTLKSWKLPVRQALTPVALMETDDFGQYSACLSSGMETQ